MENQKKAPVVQGADKYVVRFPDGMRDRIAESAKANNRSMNAEIVARLERSLTENTSFEPPHVIRLLEELLDKRFPETAGAQGIISSRMADPDATSKGKDPAQKGDAPKRRLNVKKKSLRSKIGEK